MSTAPVVSFNVDLSGNLSANAVPVPNPTGLPSAYIQVDCSKSQFFNAPFTYSVTANANGVVTNIQASGIANIDSAHITSRSQTNSSWKNTGAPNAMDVSANFNIGSQRTFKFDPSFTYTGPTAGNLGDMIMTIAAHALIGKRPETNLSTILTDFSTVSSQLRTNIGSAVRTALSSPVNSDAIFQTMILANGPITQVPTTQGVFNYNLTFDSTYSGMIIALNLINLQVNITYYSTPRTLTLNVLPVWLNIV